MFRAVPLPETCRVFDKINLGNQCVWLVLLKRKVFQDVSCTSRSSWVNSKTTESTTVLRSVYSTATVQLINIKCRSRPHETVYMPIHYSDKFSSIKLSCLSRLYTLIIRYALECHISCRNTACVLKYYKYCICIKFVYIYIRIYGFYILNVRKVSFKCQDTTPITSVTNYL